MAVGGAVAYCPGMSFLRRWVRVTAGLGLGAVAALVEAGFLLLVGLFLLPVLPWPGLRQAAVRRVGGLARALAGIQRRRLAAFLGSDTAGEGGDGRALWYLAAHLPVGLLGGAVLLLLAAGLLFAKILLDGWTIAGVGRNSAWFAVLVLLGVVLLFLNVQGIVGVAAIDRRLARRLLGPGDRELLRRRIAELSASRSDVVDAVDDERRRIERDLHDGVQQQLVALGVLLGRARRGSDPDRVGVLLRQAHEASQNALRDLREVAWRVYPPALEDGGLQVALEAVAERSGVPVRLRYDLAARPGRQVESVLYFVVSEAVTNAAKHSGADLVTVEVARRARTVVAEVRDNGRGGADASGGGLSGLARRVAALDGRFAVHSPPGGPTTITAELPCA
jgi:signal transduction histidine kinase